MTLVYTRSWCIPKFLKYAKKTISITQHIHKTGVQTGGAAAKAAAPPVGKRVLCMCCVMLIVCLAYLTILSIHQHLVYTKVIMLFWAFSGSNLGGGVYCGVLTGGTISI